MLHQYAHIKSWKSQPRESQREKEGKTNFGFILSSWKDGSILKLSTGTGREPSSPLPTDQVWSWHPLLGDAEGVHLERGIQPSIHTWKCTLPWTCLSSPHQVDGSEVSFLTPGAI